MCSLWSETSRKAKKFFHNFWSPQRISGTRPRGFWDRPLAPWDRSHPLGPGPREYRTNIDSQRRQEMQESQLGQQGYKCQENLCILVFK